MLRLRGQGFLTLAGVRARAAGVARSNNHQNIISRRRRYSKGTVAQEI